MSYVDKKGLNILSHVIITFAIIQVPIASEQEACKWIKYKSNSKYIGKLIDRLFLLLLISNYWNIGILGHWSMCSYTKPCLFARLEPKYICFLNDCSLRN